MSYAYEDNKIFYNLAQYNQSKNSKSFKHPLIPKVLFIPFWIFDVLGRYLGQQLFLEIFETLYKCVTSIELCGKLIFTKSGLTV